MAVPLARPFATRLRNLVAAQLSDRVDRVLADRIALHWDGQNREIAGPVGLHLGTTEPIVACQLLPQALDPGPVMIVMGLVSLIFAAFMLYQRRDIKRFFAYSSIEHMGLIVFAFGMGGPLANFAGLLHMAMHSLTKSGIFFAVGHIAQAKGSQRFADIAGLSVTHPRLAVAFALAVVAIAGLPPFGVFTSEFLILTTTFAREPWLALLPAFGLLVGFGALLLRLQGTIFGEPVGPAHRVDASSVPLVLHLLLVLAAGIFLPPALVAWFQRAAELLG